VTSRPANVLSLALAAFLALLLASAALGQELVVRGRVVAITDGDTVKALTADNQLLRIRLQNIDAPEISQAFGHRSKQHLSELVLGRRVDLHTHGLDRYSRVLATVSSLLSRWFFLVGGFTNSARLTCGEITSSARLTSGTGGD
jgi:endonuclease YncB( thermonuclease family)